MPGRVRSPAERPLVRRQDLWCRHHGAAARGPAADLRLMAVRTAGTDAHLVPPLGVVKYLVAQHTAGIWARCGIGARPWSSAWSSIALLYGGVSAACSGAGCHSSGYRKSSSRIVGSHDPLFSNDGPVAQVVRAHA